MSSATVSNPKCVVFSSSGLVCCWPFAVDVRKDLLQLWQIHAGLLDTLSLLAAREAETDIFAEMPFNKVMDVSLIQTCIIFLQLVGPHHARSHCTADGCVRPQSLSLAFIPGKPMVAAYAGAGYGLEVLC